MYMTRTATTPINAPTIQYPRGRELRTMSLSAARPFRSTVVPTLVGGMVDELDLDGAIRGGATGSMDGERLMERRDPIPGA